MAVNIRIVVCGIQLVSFWLCSYAPDFLLANILSWICLSSLIFQLFSHLWVLYKKRLLQFSIKDSILETLKEEDPVLHQQYASKQLKGQKLTAYQDKIVQTASQLENRYQKLFSEVTDEVTEPNFLNFVCCFFGEPQFLAPEQKLVHHNESYKRNSFNHPDCPICLEEWTEGTPMSTLQGCGHAFHRSCWDTWSGISISCPVCRQVSEYRYNHDHEVPPTFQQEVTWRKEKFLNLFRYWWPTPCCTNSAIVVYPYFVLAVYRSIFGCWLGYAYVLSATFLFGDILIYFGHCVLCAISFAFMFFIASEHFKTIDPEFWKFMNGVTEATIENLSQAWKETADPVKFANKKTK